MLPGRACLRGLWRNTRAKHYSEGSGMLPWNAPSPPPHSGSQQLLPHPPCSSQAPGSPEPEGSPPCLTQSLGKPAQLPELTATQHPPSPDPTLRWLTAKCSSSCQATPSTFSSSILPPRHHQQRPRIAAALGVPFPQEALLVWMSELPWWGRDRSESGRRGTWGATREDLNWVWRTTSCWP